MKKVVIVGASRTPMGGFHGELSQVTASELGGAAIKGAIEGAGVKHESIDEVIMGNVLSAGQGQAPARQASFKAGLSESVPAVTLNKMCGSGLKSVIYAHDQIKAGTSDLVAAGGMESMTNAPYLSPKMRGGARVGHQQMYDHMFLDGLEDAYEPGRLMGTYAEDTAELFQFTREQQDEYSIGSLNNALNAQKEDAFNKEISPVIIKTRKGEVTIIEDEQPKNAQPEKIPNLKPAFKKDGTVTAANSSSISDGAAALIISSEERANELSLPVRATILGHTVHAHQPGMFTTAPIPAAKKLLERIGWSTDDVDLWEVNEAFAVVPMGFMKELNISREKINVNGGACALGHPIGASGARILVTLLNALEKRNLKKGVAAICLGGGEGLAMAIERP
jgi:acetyl-CoA C-acetyltransferase|tara:strand:+ start:617 stop:1795 length:1179 start_codon:yes stop_codon:yes gene_type:complete